VTKQHDNETRAAFAAALGCGRTRAAAARLCGVSLLAPHRRVDGGRGESYHNRRCNNAQCKRASHREPNATRAIADNARRLLAGDRLNARRTAPRAVLAVLSNPSATHEPRDVARAAFFAQAAPS
jgi:hypothetical protein